MLRDATAHMKTLRSGSATAEPHSFTNGLLCRRALWERAARVYQLQARRQHLPGLSPRGRCRKGQSSASRPRSRRRRHPQLSELTSRITTVEANASVSRPGRLNADAARRRCSPTPNEKRTPSPRATSGRSAITQNERIATND